ncbi:MAG: MarC family protein [Bacteroidia bacterium]|jgi:multiple antibiotic resistance protein|nr:MarC family protein [Bacteroidia bacterium]
MFDSIVFFSIVVGLFSLINPISILPVYISLTGDYTEAIKLKTLKKTCTYIVGICLLAYFLGVYLLMVFGISIQALRVAGGLIIFRSGWQLLHLKHKQEFKGEQLREESEHKVDISFSPLAMPLLAGPGAMSFLITLYANRETGPMNAFWQDVSAVSAIVFVALVIYVMFKFAPRLMKYTGKSGLDSLSKIMGFIVTGVGVQMILSSLTTLAQSLLKDLPQP